MPVISPKLLALEERVCRRLQEEGPDLLAELSLSQNDVEELLSLVPVALRHDPDAGLRVLARSVPTTLALFLVWQGILSYSDGSYWPALRDAIGVPDQAWESYLGSFFLAFVQGRGMAAPADQEGHRYVTPILLHGGIPVSCLPEFFREIIWLRLARDGVRDYARALRDWREDYRQVRDSGVQQRIDRINEKRARCRLDLLELTGEANDQAVSHAGAEKARLRANLEAVELALAKTEDQLHQAQALRVPAQEAESCDRELRLIGQRLGQVREQQRGVEDAAANRARQLSRGGGRQVGTALVLAGLVGAVVLTGAGDWAPAVLLLFLAAGGAGWMRRRDRAAQHSAEGMLARGRDLAGSVESLAQELAEVGRRVRDLRLDLVPDLPADPEEALDSLQAAVDQWRQEVAGAPRIIEAAASAIRELQTRRDNLTAGLRQAECGLDASRRSPTPGKEVSREAIEQLREEMKRLNNERLELERQFQSHPLMWVERPIQRFLLHGGSLASELVSEIAGWLEQARGGEDVPQRPGRGHYRELVRQAFLEWWETEGRSLAETSARPRRPGIVCWKEAREWVVGVTSRGLATTRVVCDGTALDESRRMPGYWPLKRLGGVIRVEGKDAVTDLAVATLGQGGHPCYLFRGWGGHRSRPAPLVRRPTVGQLMALVPDTWRRNVLVPRAEPIAPEPAVIGGYQVHFLDLGPGGTGVSFTREDGQLLGVAASVQQYELEGAVVEGEEQLADGPLFIGAPPALRSLTPGGWQLASRVELHHVGLRLRLFSTEFTPAAEGSIQPIEGLDHDTSGRFAITIFDHEGDVAEDLAFRYIGSVHAITVAPPDRHWLPPAGGYPEVTVELEYGPESAARLGKLLEDMATRTGKGLRIALPPDPRWDAVTIEMRSRRGVVVPVRLVMERVWWRVPGLGQNTDWTDKPLDLARDVFRADSERKLEVRLPPAGPVSQVAVGFSREGRRTFRVSGRQVVEIPLREFCDAREVAQPAGGHALYLWLVNAEGQDLAGCQVGSFQRRARVVGPPEQRRSCSTCDDAKAGYRFRCVQGEWTDKSRGEFFRDWGSYCCERWRGEYQDEQGCWHER